MTRVARLLIVAVVLASVSCVTINIYFPAEEMRQAADKIVHEVWGERPVQPQPQPPASPTDNRGGFILPLLGVASAHAVQNIEVSTPEIRAIQESMRRRAESLFPYLDQGVVGVGRDALLKVRSSEGLDLRARGEVNRLVNAENDDRQRLYREIARANGFPERAGEVQQIFAESWRQRAAAGWFIEQADGSWQRK